MKSLVVILSILSIMSATAASVSPKALLNLESRIEIQKQELSKKLNAVDTEDMVEGKIIAATANLIESKLELAEKEILSIDSDEELTEANVAKIEKILNESEKLIKEI